MLNRPFLRDRLASGCVGLLLGLGLATGGAVAQEAPAEGGWITQEQAERGAQLYAQRCSGCHGEDIVPAFAAYPNAGLFFGFVSTAMPADAPGSLPQQQYADIIAHLLVANGMDIGTEELPPDRAVLSEIKPSELDSGGAN